MKKLAAIVLVISFSLVMMPGTVLADEELMEEVALNDSVLITEQPIDEAINENQIEELEPTETEALPQEQEGASDDMKNLNTPKIDLPDTAYLLEQYRNEGKHAETMALELPAPKNFKVSLYGADGARLTWSKVSGAAGYSIYCYTNSSNGAIIAVLDSNTTSFTVAGMTPGVKYYFCMAAHDMYGNMGKITDHISPQILPTPENFKAVSAGYNSVKVTWNRLSGADGYYISRYYKNPAYGSVVAPESTVLVTPGSKTSYTDRNLITGKTYYYIIRPEKDGILGNINFKTAVAAKPLVAKPANVKASSLSDQKIKITWNKSAGASGYSIYRSKSKDNNYSHIKTVGNGVTEYVNDGLTVNTSYYYKVVPYRNVSGTKVKGVSAGPVSAKAK